MEHSLNPSMGKAVSGSANEESGWTSYFEEFSKGMEQQSYCSNLGGSSLVSDAASCAAWKLSHHNHLVSHPSNNNVVSKKLRFKKTRTQQISDDDPLEDTASSPVNSPKGKEFNSEHHPKLQADECDINFNGNNIECNTNLKKKGLCLVPLSMLVNYYG
ncbi:hypothetical protein GLYMA_13G308000v4 [Glycine max]|uniref:Uncharacterized protein n=1 Tax=Glycine max TaxID=3847 RepID=K7M2W0_SOYBN|nr:uncharacterized protein LOC100306218 isoform X1 [Glycine max]XP_028186286.1 vascular-related unknown protein 1-like isoform X2 [Glycine soja]KRH22547.1 hypothetical protein GLYMA_13G308000v4 [Glycine max]|eukprot:XP_006593347.1 uncharacterized protein LOC100306218 isoform X1 [Glycine max]